MMEVVVTSGAIRHAKLQSSSQIVTINKATQSSSTGRMPILSPNQQCQSTEGNPHTQYNRSDILTDKCILGGVLCERM